MTRNEGWIDISMPLKEGMVVYPGDPPLRIVLAPGTAKDGPAAISMISMGLHSGTHIDAPRHLFKEGLSIDLLPLGVFTGTARVIESDDAFAIEARDVRSQTITKGEMVFFKTRNSGLYRLDLFCEEYVHLTRSAAAYLVETGVAAVGMDYLSIDAFGDQALEAHSLLLSHSIPIIEGLDLSSVSPGLYECICLPLRIEGGDAAPARAMIRPLPPEP